MLDKICSKKNNCILLYLGAISQLQKKKKIQRKIFSSSTQSCLLPAISTEITKEKAKILYQYFLEVSTLINLWINEICFLQLFIIEFIDFPMKDF